MKALEHHGETRNGRKTPEYSVYREMLRRCYDPKRNSYSNYGGRGITVCRRWRRSFGAFLRDVGRRPSPQHTIDRIKNNRGYYPSNVHWATPQEQQRNTRHTRFVTFRGQRQSLVAWVEELGLDYEVVKQRLLLGWPARKALTAPTRLSPRLTEIQQAVLAEMYGKYNQYELADMFGVNQGTVSRILKRKETT